MTDSFSLELHIIQHVYINFMVFYKVLLHMYQTIQNTKSQYFALGNEYSIWQVDEITKIFQSTTRQRIVTSAIPTQHKTDPFVTTMNSSHEMRMGHKWHLS